MYIIEFVFPIRLPCYQVPWVWDSEAVSGSFCHSEDFDRDGERSPTGWGREHFCGKETQIDTFPENLLKIPVHFHKNWNDQEKRLWVGETEVGVVYMRCGYHPDQYPTQRSISYIEYHAIYHLSSGDKNQRKEKPNTPSLESGTRDWWWRGPWLSSLPASTTTSPAPRRWSFSFNDYNCPGWWQ